MFSLIFLSLQDSTKCFNTFIITLAVKEYSGNLEPSRALRCVYSEDCLTRNGLDQCILLLVLVNYSSVIKVLLLLICWFPVILVTFG